jgi:Zn finger protein HypA/HybF involved in hydrogenase expression
LRRDLAIGVKTVAAVCSEDSPIEDVRRDAETHPQEYFKCPECGTGPWHITYGAYCPDCMGS